MKNTNREYSEEQPIVDRLGKFPENGLTDKSNERDWILVKALSMQRMGLTKEAEILFRQLIEYHTKPAGPYGSGLFVYTPNSSSIAYGMALAQIAGLECESEKLKPELEKTLNHERILMGRRNLQHIILRESDKWSTG